MWLMALSRMKLANNNARNLTVKLIDLLANNIEKSLPGGNSWAIRLAFLTVQWSLIANSTLVLLFFRLHFIWLLEVSAICSFSVSKFQHVLLNKNQNELTSAFKLE